ncbi:glycosyltransferase [Lysobacter capsici]|uniref:glycosyltransferase n=1 Tax=Lysobacter capsici TaxID=435897 RepID=UPI0018DF5B7F|nr:glycosyltransferase [Lysobacter capsici]
MRKLKVTIVDMQPITPAIGGGRQRLLGLYHALGEHVEATYVGSYDWPGESFRDQQLTAGLREICVPLSKAHHAAVRDSAQRMDGRTMIDLEFSEQAALSPEYLGAAREYIAGADVVVFSHPWAFPPLRQDLRPEQLVVYDSQNVESVLRTSLHDDLTQADPILTRVAQTEYDLCHAADLVLACSHDDRDTFHRLYDVTWEKLRVVPNGIAAFAQAVPTPQERKQDRERLGLSMTRPLAVFLGSNYGPNNEAANFVATQLAPALPNVDFAILGSCCQALALNYLPKNVRELGTVSEEEKRQWMRAADIAVNPLTRGSGTSIKMFDFMAAGLATVTTEIGCRGIVHTGEMPFEVAPVSGFVEAVRRLVDDVERRDEIALRARKVVENFYAWERISPSLGRLLRKRWEEKQGAAAYFTVVIPSYERPALLDRLMDRLRAQVERDFEVVIIDQSAERWPAVEHDHGFPLTYVHSPIKGAVKARNFGGYLASGKVIAFTDDDCEPKPTWLSNARDHLRDPSVVGLEGLVSSDHLGDPDWRPVSNKGFEGIGFMTANLLVRNEVFQRLDGFDLSFDEPHFREDSDFGWRMQALGAVPYCEDVEVYHPAHKRDVARESSAERTRFFEKDALLLKKHPERYKTLFFAEEHYVHTNGYWEHLERGASKYQVKLPSWIKDLRQQ